MAPSMANGIGADTALDSVGPRVNDPGDLVQGAESCHRSNEAEPPPEPHQDMRRPNCTFGLINDYRGFNSGRNRHAKAHGKMHEGRNGGGLSRKAILSETCGGGLNA